MWMKVISLKYYLLHQICLKCFNLNLWFGPLTKCVLWTWQSPPCRGGSENEMCIKAVYKKVVLTWSNLFKCFKSWSIFNFSQTVFSGRLSNSFAAACWPLRLSTRSRFSSSDLMRGVYQYWFESLSAYGMVHKPCSAQGCVEFTRLSWQLFESNFVISVEKSLKFVNAAVCTISYRFATQFSELTARPP